MKSKFKKIINLTMAASIFVFSTTAFANGNQLVTVDLWNETSNQASMGNVATDNNEEALYNPSTNTLQIAFNPVNISGYISGVTELLYDTTGNGDFLEVTVLETGTVESGTRNDGNNYTVNYIQKLEIELPSNLTKKGEEYIDLQMKVPHTPMDTVIADGHLGARLKIDWDTVKTTELLELEADDTMSGGVIENLSYQDKKTGIKIVGDSSKINLESKLYVETVTSGDDFKKAEEAIGSSNFNLYDVRLAVNGLEVDLLGAVEFRIPFTGDLEVYRITDDGKTLVRGASSFLEYSFLTNKTGLIAVVGGNKENIELISTATDNGSLKDAQNSDKPSDSNVSEAPTVSGNPFTDIETHWAKENILFAVSEGLFSGVSENTFNPDGSMTGGMVISVLHRLAGSPEAVSTSDMWYGKAVAWGLENDIIGDYNDFDAEKNVTREEFGVMLYRFDKIENNPSDTADLTKFADSDDISDWAVDGLAWANAVGIISGSSPTTISPKDDANRAVVATMFCRYIEL